MTQNPVWLLLALLSSVPAFAAGDEIFSIAAGQNVPIADSEIGVPATVTRSAVQALVANGASVEDVSEQDAIARAASHGVVIAPRARTDANFGRPWAIIKAGFGVNSEINLLAEIYVNDNWSIDPHLNVGLNYSAAMLGVGWHPDALCWNCKGKAGFSIGTGLEGGTRNDTDDTNDARTGIMIATSLDAQAILRPMKHLIFTTGVRLSGGAFFEAPTYTNTFAPPSSTPTSPPNSGTPNPAPQPGAPVITGTVESSPARVVPTFDAMFYIGIGF